MGGFWFNPYLPFGGSSCTSIAQRQSDAIRDIAKAVGINAKCVAMLDDFLFVVPRKPGDTDERALIEREKVGRRFDELVESLNLPKAPEKDQQSAFTTT